MSGWSGSLCCYAFSSLFSFVACLLLLLIDEPWCSRVDYTMLPCPDPGVLPICTWSIRLALGCPTHRPGTWLPNTLTWYTIGTWLPNSTLRHTVAQPSDMVSGRHMGAHHVFRSTRLYISFDLHQRASYWLWYYATSIIIRRLHVMHYGHIILVYMFRLNCVYIPPTLIHTILCSSTWCHSYMYIVTVGRAFIGTPVNPDFSMLHSMYTSSLRYLSAPHYLSWRYSIICYRSSQRFRVLSVSIHHPLEPFVINWLYGLPVVI